jgi:antitoxin PrlF
LTEYYSLNQDATMEPALTVKSQVTIPKSIREFLGIGPGARIAFEPMSDSRVAIRAVNPTNATKPSTEDPISAMIGVATRKVKTVEVMRMTRGDDWNQA